MSTTVVRTMMLILTPLGAAGGTFIALVKLMPERAKTIMGYQVAAITSLQAENERLLKRIAALEKRVEELEAVPRPLRR